MRTKETLRDDERSTKKKFRTAAADLKDRVNETRHRAGAAGEHAKRAVFGDVMTTTQKVTSAAKEAGHRTAAAVDKAKRKIKKRARK